MKHPSPEDLLGYVLGALDAQEHRELQQTIDQNPQIEEELLRIKSSLMPLDELDTAGPKAGLARRTCEAVASWEKTQSSADSASPDRLSAFDLVASSSQSSTISIDGDLNTSEAPPAKLRPAVSQRLLHPTTWSISDVLVGVALLLICAGILFPTISYARNNSRILACQNNLRQVGLAMMNYSSINEGNFVAIPSAGNLAASGCYAPILKDAGLVEDDSIFACAGISAQEPPVHIAARDQIESADSEEEINHYRRTMGGHFGYTMGYCENEKYCPPRYMGRTNIVLLADQPSNDLTGRRSSNHNGKGQNCLFEDGRVAFIKGHALAGDAIFENDYGIVAPGSHPSDNVIAPSHLTVRVNVTGQ